MIRFILSCILLIHFATVFSVPKNKIYNIIDVDDSCNWFTMVTSIPKLNYNDFYTIQFWVHFGCGQVSEIGLKKNLHGNTFSTFVNHRLNCTSEDWKSSDLNLNQIDFKGNGFVKISGLILDRVLMVKINDNYIGSVYIGYNYSRIELGFEVEKLSEKSVNLGYIYHDGCYLNKN
ncbi:hypothetical protein [Chrysanthemum mosaic-associated virus]|uniref:Uncharacterized protein n=1 Tax=Chrysanthemum mosaic-associated virus TaxID=2746510 RepID=A0AAU9BL63_9VIRU|nr:hypothetical protein QK754_sRNA5gp1 [Chrysanthemum mosaic-associated virus]BCK60946.1 hypothetical protein [Chrysanthemum mosaic-associated virus]